MLLILLKINFFVDRNSNSQPSLTFSDAGHSVLFPLLNLNGPSRATTLPLSANNFSSTAVLPVQKKKDPKSAIKAAYSQLFQNLIF